MSKAHNLQQARLLRDEAIQRVEQNASQQWMKAAMNAIRYLAARQPELTTDDLWEILQKPREPRAAGAAFKWAEKAGIIEATPRYTTSTQKSNHARPIRVWRSLIVNGAHDAS